MKGAEALFASRYRTIGLKIGYYRRAKNLTQVELADQVGISSQYLSRIERGLGTGASLDIYWKIAEVLGVTFEDFSKSE